MGQRKRIFSASFPLLSNFLSLYLIISMFFMVIFIYIWFLISSLYGYFSNSYLLNSNKKKKTILHFSIFLCVCVEIFRVIHFIIFICSTNILVNFVHFVFHHKNAFNLYFVNSYKNNNKIQNTHMKKKRQYVPFISFLCTAVKFDQS